jgi:hypothetical protein
MNFIEIAIASPATYFVQENDIFGQSYFLEFEWIEREAFWMLHLSDGFDKPLSSGIILHIDWPLYTHHDKAGPFTLFLHAKKPGSSLIMHSLSRDSILRAYDETV